MPEYVVEAEVAAKPRLPAGFRPHDGHRSPGDDLVGERVVLVSGASGVVLAAASMDCSRIFVKIVNGEAVTTGWFALDAVVSLA